MGDQTGSQRYGLLGQNIAYSLSPTLYPPWFDRQGIKVSFDLIDTPTCDDAFLDDLCNHYGGFCITIPYKQVAYRWAVSRGYTPESLLQAINVVTIRDGHISATNTDATALITLLSPYTNYLSRPLILGRGAAAQTSLYGLFKLAQSRFPQTINDETYQNFTNTIPLITRDHMPLLLEKPTVLINATPLGAGRVINEVAYLEKLIHTLDLSDVKLVVDWVYGQHDTFWLKWAKNNEIPTVNGYDLLITQAQANFTLWTRNIPLPMPTLKASEAF